MDVFTRLEKLGKATGFDGDLLEHAEYAGLCRRFYEVEPNARKLDLFVASAKRFIKRIESKYGDVEVKLEPPPPGVPDFCIQCGYQLFYDGCTCSDHKRAAAEVLYKLERIGAGLGFNGNLTDHTEYKLLCENRDEEAAEKFIARIETEYHTRSFSNNFKVPRLTSSDSLAPKGGIFDKDIGILDRVLRESENPEMLELREILSNIDWTAAK